MYDFIVKNVVMESIILVDSLTCSVNFQVTYRSRNMLALENHARTRLFERLVSVMTVQKMFHFL